MKKLNLLKTMLLLCALIVGSGSVWAAEEVYKTALFGSSYNDNNSSYTGSFDATNGTFVVTAANFNNNNNGWTNSTTKLGQIKCGRRNNASTGTITTKNVIDEAVTKVVVTVDAFTSGKVNSFKLYVASDASFTQNLQTITETIATGENTFTVTNPTANQYYKVEIDCASGSANGLVTVSKVEYYHNATVAVTGITLNKSELSLAVDETETLTATVAPDNATNKTVTWSSSDETIATVDENGEVTAVAVGGPVTITATANDGSGQTATCAVTVIAARVDVTGVSLNKNAASLYVGDTETLTATITPADATNQTVSWTSSDEDVANVEDGVVTAVGIGTATITVTTEDGNFTATCAVTVSPVAVSSVSLNKTSTSIVYGGTETLTATVLPANATNKNVTWSSNNDAIASVEDGVVTANAVGTATITVTTDDGSKTATCVVTVTADDSKPELNVTIFEETFDKISGSGGRDGSYSGNIGTTSSFETDETWETIGSHGANKCYRIGTSSSETIKTGTISLTGSATLTFNAAGWATGTNSFTVSATGATLSGDTNASLEASTWKAYTVNITEATGSVQISFAGNRGFLDDVKITTTASTVDVTLNASGFASYCSPFALDLTPTDDYKAYAVSAAGGKTVTFTKIPGKVAANTPFVLYNADKASTAVSLPIIEDDDEDIKAVTGNALVGTLSPTYVEAAEGYTNFGMSGSKFVKMNAGTVKANKAYLPVSNDVIGSDVREFSIVFDDDETTDIKQIEVSTLNTEGFYNLNGQRVAQPTKGLYIVNGKKVIIK